jgi:hypothetical protein
MIRSSASKSLPRRSRFWLLRAVSIAFHHAEKGAPRAYRLAVLMRHNAQNLVEVREIMHRPGGQQLRQRHCSECWMASLALHVFRGEGLDHAIPPGSSRTFANSSRICGRLLALHSSTRPPATEGVKGPRFSIFQNHPCSRKPIYFIGINQVAYNIEGCKRAFTFVALRPFRRQIAEQHIQSARRALKQRNRCIQVMLHACF